MKILFIGCVKSSFHFLKAVYEQTSAEIVGVVTKVESNYNADHVSLHPFCEENNIDWIDYKDSDQLLYWIKEKNPDIIYCFGWSYLLPREVYEFPKLGAVGYHPTLLPKNRGRHPIIWTIALGLKETGSTFFYLSDLPDSGDILSQEKLSLEENETANTLYEKLLKIGKQQVIKLTNELIEGTLSPTIQDTNKATYWRKRGKLDGKIDWRMSSSSILNLINALSKPYVGSYFDYDNTEIKVWKAEKVESNNMKNSIPGEIIDVGDNFFIVKTADQLLKVIDYEGDFKGQPKEYL